MSMATRIAAQRGQLLEMLRMEYPAPAADKTLLAVMQNELRHDLTILDVRQHLEFLSGLELVTIVKKLRDPWIVTLTSKSLQLLEGVIPEIPGIVIAR
jgi:hypothetical protein